MQSNADSSWQHTRAELERGGDQGRIPHYERRWTLGCWPWALRMKRLLKEFKSWAPELSKNPARADPRTLLPLCLDLPITRSPLLSAHLRTPGVITLSTFDPPHSTRHLYLRRSKRFPRSASSAFGSTRFRPAKPEPQKSGPPGFRDAPSTSYEPRNHRCDGILSSNYLETLFADVKPDPGFS